MPSDLSSIRCRRGDLVDNPGPHDCSDDCIAIDTDIVLVIIVIVSIRATRGCRRLLLVVLGLLGRFG